LQLVFALVKNDQTYPEFKLSVSLLTMIWKIDLCQNQEYKIKTDDLGSNKTDNWKVSKGNSQSIGGYLNSELFLIFEVYYFYCS